MEWEQRGASTKLPNCSKVWVSFVLPWSSPLIERTAAGGNILQNTVISCLWLSHIIIPNLKSHSDRGSKRNLILTHIDFWPHNWSSWFSYNLKATLPWPTSRSLSSPAANGIPIRAERTISDTEIHCQCREVHLVGARFQSQNNLSLPLGCLPDYNGDTPVLPSCETTAVVCSKESSVGEIWRHKHLYLDVAFASSF